MARIERKLSAAGYVKKAVRTAPSVATCARLFRNWWRLTRIFAGKLDFTPPMEAIGRKGYRLELLEPGDVETLWDVFCQRSYRVPAGCRTIVDAGANIGAFSLYALKETGVETDARVWAAEPVAASFARLQATVARNGLGRQVECLPFGIGATWANRTIALGAASKNATLYLAPEAGGGGPGLETIQVRPLADLLDATGQPEIDLLKMDCEGGEVEALMAADDGTLRRCRAISMEYHFYRDIADEASLLGRLAAAGFDLRRHHRAKRLAHFLRCAR